MKTAATPSDTPFGLCRLIGRIRGELVLGIEQALAESGVDLNFSQFLALKRLGEDGPMAPGELARCVHYSPGALTRVLDKLEQAGYLQRIPDPDDRRALRLQLTPAGRAVNKRMIACGDAAAEHAFSELSETERLQLRSLLERVLDHLYDEREHLAGS
ncbi:MAG TPA: MarR family transcriptional regulator [Rhodanobacteraceae bacterium]|nr:MarR family transcriptional regulator [Rhodanobacteraceae bacterium]